MIQPANLVALLQSLAIGLAGSVIFVLLQLPVPWLLGSMFASSVVAKLMATTARQPLMPVPSALEKWMRVAIGVSLGPAVASSVAENSADLPFAIISAVLVTLATALLGMRWFQTQTSLPRSSAFLSALPGGLSVFLGLAGDIDNRALILLAHTIRVVIVVVFISLMARFLGIPTQAHPLMASLNWSGDAAPQVLVALVVVGFVVAERLKIAGGHVIFSMLLTAVLAAVTELPLQTPAIVQSIAMLVFGVVLGQEIAAAPGGENKRLVIAATLFSGFAILFVACVAFVLSGIVSPGFLVLFLALAPGGIAEVSLVALALGLDAGLVALVHSCRFLFIVLAGPLAFRFFRAKVE